MKKLIGILMVIFSLFVITGCTNFKEVDLTQKEVNELIENINYETLTDETMLIALEIDSNIYLDVYIPDKFGMIELHPYSKISGDLEIYLDLRNYDDMKVIVSFDLDLDVDINQIGGFKPVSGEIKGNLYIINGTRYLDFEYKNKGIEVKGNNKEADFFKEKDYESLVNYINKIDKNLNLDKILNNFNFDVYQSGNKHKLEKEVNESMTTDLLDTLGEFLLGSSFSDGSQIEIIENNKHEGKTTILFSNKLDEITSSLKSDFIIDFIIDEEDSSGRLKVYLDYNFKFKSKVKLPKMPSLKELNKYSEEPLELPFS